MISELEIIRVLKHNPTTISFARKLGLSIVLNRLFMYLSAFVAALGLICSVRAFLTVMSKATSCCSTSFHCSVFLLQSTDSRHTGFQQLQPAGSVGMTMGLNCSVECGIFSEQGLNPCARGWQADSYPL